MLDAACGIHLFGAGGFARDTAAAAQAEGIAVHAFLTSGVPPQPELDGLPCRQLSAVDLRQHPLWIAVFNHQHHSDYGALQRWLHGLDAQARPIWPQAWYPTLATRLGWRFWLHALAAYAAAREAIAALRQRLDDEASRSALDAIVAFRSEARCFAQPPVPSAEPQYLPRWLREVLTQRGIRALRIADCGAYQGETLRELDALLPVERAWAFEPDPANLEAMRAQMAGWAPRLAIVAAGVSDVSGSIAFDGGSGAASRVADSGGLRIRTVALDEALAGEDPNFIKLDVEGHELAALAGARETIRRARPVLAISAYHRWDDLWRITAFVDELKLGYRLRLEVHQHNSFDSVVYAF